MGYPAETKQHLSPLGPASATDSSWVVRPSPPASPSPFDPTLSDPALSPMDTDLVHEPLPPPTVTAETAPGPVSLGDILDGGVDTLGSNGRDHTESDHGGSGSDTDSVKGRKKPSPVGYCVECEDQPAMVFCEQCADDFCEVCFHSQHRKGSRKKHVSKKLQTSLSQKKARRSDPNVTHQTRDGGHKQGVIGKILKYLHPQAEADASDAPVADDSMDHEPDSSKDLKLMGEQPTNKAPVGDWFLERAKYIPLRLTLEERKFLRLLEAGLNVSEYTDKIDILAYGSKNKRIVGQIKELCAILSGLVLAADYKVGQELFQDRNFQNNAEFFQEIFELGRRHKIMNPEKMRSTYGKLVYLLQDAQIPDVVDMLEFSCVKPIKTVYNVLEEMNGLKILQDELIGVATQEILSEGRSRYQVQQDIKNKERAIERLVRKYSSSGKPDEVIRQCLYSIGDNHAFLRVNRDPCDKMIAYLQQFFDANKEETGFSLAIRSGKGGARLSHDHNKQYQYVLQSLTLWREIMHDMFMLWTLAEQDLLSPNNPYRLRDTGQGLNRVQPAPKVSRMMHTILHRAQQRVGYWVGSSVIHLGDHNVPNALMFIDKYTQIYRILLPICNTLNQIDNLHKNPGLAKYIDEQFNGPDNLRKTILVDFFRHAFDGSGADNFFDAGSCIDGRLTSAWNWCATLEKKPFFPVFLLSGFVGFDGQW